MTIIRDNGTVLDRGVSPQGRDGMMGRGGDKDNYFRPVFCVEHKVIKHRVKTFTLFITYSSCKSQPLKYAVRS